MTTKYQVSEGVGSNNNIDRLQRHQQPIIDFRRLVENIKPRTAGTLGQKVSDALGEPDCAAKVSQTSSSQKRSRGGLKMRHLRASLAASRFRCGGRLSLVLPPMPLSVPEDLRRPAGGPNKQNPPPFALFLSFTTYHILSLISPSLSPSLFFHHFLSLLS